MTPFVRNLSTAVGNLHVTTKLMAAFALMVLLTLLASIEGAYSAAILYNRANTLFNQDLTGISAIKEAAIFQIKCARTVRDIVLANGDKDVVEDQRQILTELQSSVDEWLTAAQQAFSDAESQARIKAIKQEIPQVKELSKRVADLEASGDRNAIQAALKEVTTHTNRVNLEIAEICRLREAAAKLSQTECDRIFRKCWSTILAYAAFTVLFAIALCLLILRMIARPLVQVMATLQKASSGDLTERLKIRNNDEIGAMGRALNEALESTRVVLQKVRETTSSLRALSTELATAADGMAEGAKAQTASLASTSSSIEEITVISRSNHEHACQANKVAARSREIAQQGHTVVKAAVAAMHEISESSEKISQIASAVDEVAFQTNMLSVNAAIEAARAGDDGLSFAVVADEIRTLSRKSTDSARSIHDLIVDSLRTVENGASSINRSGETLEMLSSSVTEVTDFVTHIMNSSEKQSKGVEQVHSAVLQVDQITQTNAAQAAMLSVAATSLSTQAHQLQSMLERFTLETEAHKLPVDASATA